jgi:nitrogen regulatory protein PII
LDAFDVSHTKDDILWLGDEEEKVEKGLATHCGDYKEVAKAYRRGENDDRGPSSSEVDVAVDELEKELKSPEFVDKVKLDIIPPEEAVKESVETIIQRAANRDATYQAQIEDMTVKGYLETDSSPFEPYVAVDTTSEQEVIILINVSHPHFKQLKGSDGVLNYLRHCTYDAIAEWQAMRKAGRVDPGTIKMLKDRMLRVHMDIEMHPASTDIEA